MPRRATKTRPNDRIGYLRVSTEEQAASGAGLDAQEHTIRSHADGRTWALAGLVHDDGYSAKDLNRPGITEVLRMLHDGEVGGLVVAKLDRLSRSILDFAGLMERSQREGWALVIIDMDIDTSSPIGKMIAHVMASFAQFEREMIGLRTREALAAKKAAGVKLGRRPTLPAEVRVHIRSMRAAGQSYPEIARILNHLGVPTAHTGRQWWPSTVRGCEHVDDEAA